MDAPAWSCRCRSCRPGFVSVSSQLLEVNSGGGGGMLSFATNNVERMRIDNSGDVGIGTTTPKSALDVVGAINVSGGIVANAATGTDAIYTKGPESGIDMQDRDGTTRQWNIYPLGGVLYFYNGANVANISSNGMYNSSDVRLKTNIRTLDHALDDVARLRGVRFQWKKNGSPSIGVIAQEVERVFPELVMTGSDGMKAVDYDKLSAVLIEATKTLRAENQAMRAESQAMRAENAELRVRLEKIEARLDGRAAR